MNLERKIAALGVLPQVKLFGCRIDKLLQLLRHHRHDDERVSWDLLQERSMENVAQRVDEAVLRLCDRLLHLYLLSQSAQRITKGRFLGDLLEWTTLTF